VRQVGRTLIVTLTVFALRQPIYAQDICSPKARPARLNFTLKDAVGKGIKLADFKGKVVVLNFWATWCVPCRAEVPALVELQRAYESKGLQVIGVSIDDPPEKMKPFITQHKINYPIVTAYKNDSILDAYGPMVVVPATSVIRRDGVICTQHVGPVSKDVFEREIKSLF